MSSGPARVPVMLSVDPDRLREVVRACAAAGLVVQDELGGGIVVGEAPEDALPALARIDGVEAVERERRIQLPPPDSALQ